MAAKSFKTKAGTELPLLNLKGKEYLLVAYRLLWLNEEVANFTIDTELLQVTEDYTVARSKVAIFDTKGTLVKSSTATKREDKKQFADHTEKAETGSIGRALALLGFGTQFALQDLDEGERLADAPLEAPKKTSSTKEAPASTWIAKEVIAPKVTPLDNVLDIDTTLTSAEAPIVPAKTSGSFRRDRKTTALTTEAAEAKHAEVSNGTKGGWR